MIKILGTGMPVIGYAKIGIASEKSSRLKGAPMKFDHIELTGRERDKDGRLIPDIPLMRELAEHESISTCGGCARSKELGFPDGLPTMLPIRLPYNSIDLAFPNRLALYRGGTAFCTGDGVEAQRLKVLQEGTNNKAATFGSPEPFGPCGMECPDLKSRRCKPNARLNFVLETQKSVGGCYQYKTTSWNSIRNVIGGLEEIALITGGTLQWIPLIFEVGPQTVQPKGGGRANIAYIARVIHPGTPQQLLEAVKGALETRAPLIEDIRKLEASIESRAAVSWTETPEEGEDYEEEFYPEGDPDAPPPRDETLLDEADVTRLVEIAQTRAKALQAGLSGDELLQVFLDGMGLSDTATIPKADLPELLMELTRFSPSGLPDEGTPESAGGDEEPPLPDDEEEYGPGPSLFEGGS